MFSQIDPTNASSAFPQFVKGIPPGPIHRWPFEARFARSIEELRAVQRLRFEVFNIELDEGLDASYALARDEDEFDKLCHHLTVFHTPTGVPVGTYRLQTLPMAQDGVGFYSDTEFDLSGWPDGLLEASVEAGRACIGKPFRSLKVLYLLWSGLARYLSFNKKRYLFGCTSLSSQNPEDGARVWGYLEHGGLMLPDMVVQPRRRFVCCEAPIPPDDNRVAPVPRLMRAYLSLGARICGPPAIDRDFKTIDFMALFDADQMDRRAMDFFGYHG